MDPQSVYNQIRIALPRAVALRDQREICVKNLPKWKPTKIFYADRLTRCSNTLIFALRMLKITMNPKVSKSFFVIN